jgi:hypothetical protein
VIVLITSNSIAPSERPSLLVAAPQQAQNAIEALPQAKVVRQDRRRPAQLRNAWRGD